MAQVTVTAGVGKAVLNFNVVDRAYTLAHSLAAAISATYGTSGTAYDPASPPSTPAAGGYLYDVSPKNAVIAAEGYQAIVLQNSGSPATLTGGGNPAQVVLASNGGLNFSDINDTASNNTTVVVGGGNNFISFAGSKGNEAAYADSGNNTLIGGDGSTTLFDGTGINAITLGGGNSQVTVVGTDSIQLGRGAATISVDPSTLGASATVYGAASVDDPDTFSLIFANGSAASMVTGGDGSYSINGGLGGGVYTGGSAGNNVLIGGAGAVTLKGAGDGDYLAGASGHDKLTAGSGSETLFGVSGDRFIGGSGPDVIDVVSGPGISKIKLGTGTETIFAGYGSQVIVDTVTKTPTGFIGGGHYSMQFYDGSNESSTVLGGIGSFYIEVGAGGGVFTGGTAGSNVMFSDSGTVTLFGGGKNDYLSGGSAGGNYLAAAGGNSTLVASAGGGDTLVGGTGADTFNLAKELSNDSYTIVGYTAKDLIFIDPAHAASATIPGAVQIVGGNSTITLSDNTKITLVGYTGTLKIG